MPEHKRESKADRRRDKQSLAVGNVKPQLETDIRAIRDSAGPLAGRTLGVQARSILLVVVYILQLAWRGTLTEAVLGAARYLGVSVGITLWPLVKHWQTKQWR